MELLAKCLFSKITSSLRLVTKERCFWSSGDLESTETEVVLYQQDVPEDWCCEKEGVDAVEDSTVSGEHGAGVFDSCSALDGGLEEITNLGGDVEDDGKDEGLPERLSDMEDGVAAGREPVADEDEQGRCQDAAEDGSEGSFPSLSGT